MTFVVADRVQESCNSPGTGTVTLLGANTQFQSFSSGIGNGNTTFYTIADQNGSNWEVGIGTYSSTGNTLTRTTVLASSNSGSLVNFSSGLQNVWCDYPAGKAAIQDPNGIVTVPVLATNSTTNTTATLSFNASNSAYAGGASISGNYLQFVLQNKSATAGASVNYVLSNNLGTDSTYYGEFGMNSSVFSASTPTDFFSLNNGIYFSGHDGDITVGSGNGFKYYLAWGTAGQSAHVINASGAIGLNTNLGTTPALSGTTNFGTAGQMLTSQGPSATPTWTTPITSVTGTSPVVSSGGATPAISLAASYGDTQNPYGAKTANFVLAGPSTGAASAPTFRALVAADIPSTYSEFASGTALLFQQTAAPTGWTKVTTNTDAALRVTSGTVTTGGTVAFSTAFASQTPSGSVSTSISAVSGSVGVSLSAGGSIANTTAGGSVSLSSGGSVSGYTLAVADIPSHNHLTALVASSSVGYGTNGSLAGVAGASYTTSNATYTSSTGGGGSHSHGFNNPSYSFTGSAHNHTLTNPTYTGSFTFSSGTASSSFTGNAINLAVKYVDVIIATKN